MFAYIVAKFSFSNALWVNGVFPYGMLFVVVIGAGAAFHRLKFLCIVSHISTVWKLSPAIENFFVKRSVCTRTREAFRYFIGCVCLSVCIKVYTILILFVWVRKSTPYCIIAWYDRRYMCEVRTAASLTEHSQNNNNKIGSVAVWLNWKITNNQYLHKDNAYSR